MKKILICLIMALLLAGGVEAKNPRKTKRSKQSTSMQTKKSHHPSYSIDEAKSLFSETSWKCVSDGTIIGFYTYGTDPIVKFGGIKYYGQYNSDGSISVTLDNRASQDRNKTITFWYHKNQLVDNCGRKYTKISVTTL